MNLTLAVSMLCVPIQILTLDCIVYFGGSSSDASMLPWSFGPAASRCGISGCWLHCESPLAGKLQAQTSLFNPGLIFLNFFFFLNSEGQSFSKKLTQENRRGISGGQKSIQGTTYESSLWAVIVNCELWTAHSASHGKLSRLQYQRYMLGGFLNRPPSPFLRQNLSLELELIISARLAMQCAMVTFALPPGLGL